MKRNTVCRRATARRLVFAALAAGASLPSSVSGELQEAIWASNNSHDWMNGDNWSPNKIPNNGNGAEYWVKIGPGLVPVNLAAAATITVLSNDNTLTLQPQAALTVEHGVSVGTQAFRIDGVINVGGGSRLQAESVTVGAFDRTAGKMVVNGGSVDVEWDLSFGASAVAWFAPGVGIGEQTGGSVRARTVSLIAGSTYTMNWGSLRASGDLRVGGHGAGTFTQNGATSLVEVGALTIGGNRNGTVTATGTYNLNGGTLTAGPEEIGDDWGAVSKLTQAFGSTNNAGSLLLRKNSEYTCNGGTLTVNQAATILGTMTLGPLPGA